MSGSELGGFLSIADFEHAAASVLTDDVWDFVAGGSGTESSLAANRAALSDLHLVPRVLRDVSACTTATPLLGRPAAMPVAIAPMAFHRLVHPDGELATARAAAAAGVPFTVSLMSTVELGEVCAVGGTVWFQLYSLRDRARFHDLVALGDESGCAAIMVTVDLPWMGRRVRDRRNAFRLPEGMGPANLSSESRLTAGRPVRDASAVALHAGEEISPMASWADVEEVREQTTRPLILKGILSAEDARIAVSLGSDAIVVSNHGGRQLDGAVPGIAVLEEICAAVAGRCQVLVDGGFRSGGDVMKALALGADGVLVGRPALWGLSVDGEKGVRAVLDLFGTELHDALGLSGCATVDHARQIEARHLGIPAR